MNITVLLRRGLLAIALILMIGHFLIYAAYAISLTQFPFDYDQGEGFELNDTVLLSQGQSPYRNNEVYPFYASNYPPFFHVILVPFVWLFGPQYWYGRLAGFMATLITAAAIAYAVNRETRHKPVALLSGLAYLASNYVYHVGPLFRQHIMMVMFETLAVVIIAGIYATESTRLQRRKLVIGLLLLLVAGFTKQLAVATAGAIFIYLFLRTPRRAIAWGIGFGVIFGGLFLAINMLTGGQWWLNTITANVNQYIVSQFTGLLKQFIGLHGALLLLAILFAIYELYFDRLSLYTIWFAASAIDAISAGKWGAGDSYFTTMIAAMCILAGLFTARSLNGKWQWPDFAQRLIERVPLPKTSAQIVGLIGCTCFILYGLAVIHLPLGGRLTTPIAQILNVQSNTKFPQFYDAAGWTMGYATIGQIPSPRDIANGWKIIDAIHGDDRPILSEEAAFSFLTGKPVVSNPTQLLNLYNNGHYDPASLIEMIEAQAFGAVIFRARFYPQPVLDAVDRAYNIVEKIDMNGYEYTVLKPDPNWLAQQSTF